MNRKGFTLIELLDVIVILAIIAVIATPIITGIIEDSKKAAFERSTEGIVKGLELDVAFKLGDSGYTYRITDGDISGLDEDSNVSISNTKGYNGIIKYDKNALVSYAIYNDKYCIIKKDNESIVKDYVEGDCALENVYMEDILNGTYPILDSKMIAINYTSEGLPQVVDSASSDWYSYANRKWANAVVLVNSPSKTYNVGDTILESDIAAYYVWIPRFKYT